jgi:polyhydroxybutyrate depolymerase
VKNITSRKEFKIVTVILLIILLIMIVVIFGLFTKRDRGVLFSSYKTYNFQGTSRKYLLSMPDKEINRIIVGLHGFSDSSRRFAYYTGLHNVADQNTLIVYPQAIDPASKNIKKGWNSGFCCGSGWIGKVDDARFIISLIDSLKSEYNIQNAKTYAVGFSNGAFMTQRLATDYPDKFSAVASVSGSIGTTKARLAPTKQIPILLIHGEKDTVVPFYGGNGSSDPEFNWLSHQDTLETWNMLNGSDTVTEEILYKEDGHKWHGWRLLNIWTKKPKASKNVVMFFNGL